MAEPTFEQLIDSMTLEVWHNMRRAVELGRWPDGRVVSEQQREWCLQAVIAWETRNLPEEERTGFMPRKCESGATGEQPVALRPAKGTDKGEQ